MTTQADLLRRVEAFLKRTGMAPSTFGRKAINDGKLMRRLREMNIHMSTAETVERFMRDFDRAA